ncbi:hypothetical protein [Spirosoma horti]
MDEQEWPAQAGGRNQKKKTDGSVLKRGKSWALSEPPARSQLRLQTYNFLFEKTKYV